MDTDFIRQAVGEQERAFRRENVSARELRAAGGHLLTGAAGRYAVPEAALLRLCRQVNAPAAYVAGLSERLQAGLLNHHFRSGDLRADQVTVVSKGKELTSLERADLVRLTGREVLEAVLEGVGGGDSTLTPHAFAPATEANDYRFQVDLVWDLATEEVRPGDVVRAGVRLSHSLVGEQATTVEGFVLRLRCQNGLTHRDCVGRHVARTRRLPATHPAARELQLGQVRRLAGTAIASVRAKLHALRDLPNKHLENAAAVERAWLSWLEQARLSTKKLLPLLRAAWADEERQATLYGAFNALTRVGSHTAGLTHRERFLIARLSGVLAFQTVHMCKRCFTLLRREAPREPEPPTAYEAARASSVN